MAPRVAPPKGIMTLASEGEGIRRAGSVMLAAERELHFSTGVKVSSMGWVMVVLAWDGSVRPAEESVAASGKGTIRIETRKAVPLIAATASWATGLTGSMTVVSLPIKSTPSHRSWLQSPW